MNSFTKKLSSKTSQDIVFALCLVGCVFLLTYKAFHSLGDEDESLFIMNAFRLVKGDRMLVDDWHVSQLCAVFLYLPFKAFYMLVGSCNGLVLFSRLLFVFAQAVVSVFTYSVFRKYSYPGVVSAIFYLFNIPVVFLMVLYYNSLLCIFVQCCALLLFSASKSFSFGKLFFAGLFYAMAVICSPYCFLIFVAYSVAVVVSNIQKKKNSFLTLKSWLSVCGGGFVALLFLSAFVLKGNSITEIAKNLPKVFFDNEYAGGILDGFAEIFSGIKTDIGFLCDKVSVISFVLGAAVVLLCVFDRQRLLHRKIFLSLAVIWYGVFVLSVVFSDELISRISSVWTAVIVGFVCYLLTKQKNSRVFWIFFIGGMAACALRATESEMNIIAGFSIMPVCASGAAILIADVAKELYNGEKTDKPYKSKKTVRKKSDRVVAVSLMCVLALQIGFQIYCNMYRGMYTEYCYSGCDTSEKLSTELTRGPMKYIRTTESIADIYNKTLEDLDYIRKNSDGPFMVPIETDWMYLFLDELDIGTYSGYLVDTDWSDFGLQKMKLYYEYHPERYPDYIYVPYYNHRLSYDNTIQQEIYDSIINSFECTTVKGTAGYIIDVKTK